MTYEQKRIKDLEAVVAYLHTRQFLTFERMHEFFTDVCNLSISTAAVSDILNRFSQKATAAYELISEKVKNSAVTGGDETGAKVNGTKVFTFLYFPDVPPDNNASERAIRNIKVKQKCQGRLKLFKELRAMLYLDQLRYLYKK